jgi:hypothetical protein
MPELSLSKASELKLIEECKIAELLPGSSPDDRFSASGVCKVDEHFYVVFNNTPHVARLHSSLTDDHKKNFLFRQLIETVHYEDIAFDDQSRRFLILTEAEKDVDGQRKSKIREYTADRQFLDADWVDFPLDGRNKRLAGLELVRMDGQEYLLGLCEGNKCRNGRKGWKPGGGRIQIFQNMGRIWAHKGTIKLPKQLFFDDYVSVAVKKRRVAVVSQRASAVWIGQFHKKGWDLVDDGNVYILPKSKKGNTVYCNVGGIDWAGTDRLVFVSDRRRTRQNTRCQKKDQSIHLFKIPNNG